MSETPKRRGRPPLAQPSRAYNLHLRLRPDNEKDAALIAYLDAIPDRQKAGKVKAVLILEVIRHMDMAKVLRWLDPLPDEG